MKKNFLILLLLVLTLSMTGCIAEHNDKIEMNFYYEYIYSGPRELNNNDIIEITYLPNMFHAPQIKFELVYIHNDKIFMGTYDPDIKFEYCSIKVFNDDTLWDENNITEISEENIIINKKSTFWYGYNSYAVKIDDYLKTIDQKGKYKIDILFSIMVDGEKLDFKDELHFEVIEKYYD